jgi:hypothetical protein
MEARSKFQMDEKQYSMHLLNDSSFAGEIEVIFAYFS